MDIEPTLALSRRDRFRGIRELHGTKSVEKVGVDPATHNGGGVEEKHTLEKSLKPIIRGNVTSVGPQKELKCIIKMKTKMTIVWKISKFYAENVIDIKCINFQGR